MKRARHPRITVEDLRDTARLMDLFAAFHGAGLIGGSEADILWFVAAAEHALRVGRTNPCGLFVSTVREKAQRVLWIGQADEDAGRKRLRAFQENICG